MNLFLKTGSLVLCLMCGIPAFAKDCQQVMNEFTSYRIQTAGFNSTVADYILENSGVMQSWYNQRVLDEGRTLYIPFGTYEAVLNSARKVQKSSLFVRSKFAEQEQRAFRLEQNLKTCLKDKKE